MYVPRFLRLKDPALVSQWRRLRSYAEAAPHRPAVGAYVSSVRTDIEVAVTRQSSAPSFVFLHVVNVQEAEQALDRDTYLLLDEYKISLRYPFLLKYTDAVYPERAAPRPAAWRRVTGVALAQMVAQMVRRARLVSRTNLLTPSSAEAEELLLFLRDAEFHVRENVLKH